MKHFKSIASLVLLVSMTAGAVAYCHNAFAPKSIVDTIKAIRAITCQMAIETLKPDDAKVHCGDLMKR